MPPLCVLLCPSRCCRPCRGRCLRKPRKPLGLRQTSTGSRLVSRGLRRAASSLRRWSHLATRNRLLSAPSLRPTEESQPPSPSIVRGRLRAGMYYNVEGRGSDRESATLRTCTCAPCPTGKDVTSVPAGYLTSSVFNQYGRWSTYGQPTDTKVLSDVTKELRRASSRWPSVSSPRHGLAAQGTHRSGAAKGLERLRHASEQCDLESLEEERGGCGRAAGSRELPRREHARATKKSRAAATDYLVASTAESW